MSISAVAAVTKWSNATKSARLVLLCIAQSVEKGSDRTGWLGIGKICERSGYSRSQVIRLIQQLELIGEIEVITPDDGGNPSYIRSNLYRGGNGRGNANAYRLTLQKGVNVPPINGKGVNMTPLGEKGVISGDKRCQNQGIKGVIAMTHQSSERIPEGGGDTPPAPPEWEVGADGASARAAPPPQAEPEADAKARRMDGRLTSLEKMLIAGRRWMVADDGALVKMKAI